MYQYQADILAQPTALRDTLDSLHESVLPNQISDRFREGGWKRILLTGMGSSYFALLPLQLRLLEAGFPVWLVETSELIYSDAYLTPETLLVVASQSGASAETVRLLDECGSQLTILGVTNTDTSPLARRSTYCIVTRAGEEASVSCKTYLATLAAQLWLGDQLIDGAPRFSELQKLPQVVESYLDAWQQHVSELKPVLEGVKQFYLTGRGVSIAAAGTGGLIMKESVRMPAEGMSSAAFRHGPFEMTGPETFVLVFAGSGKLVALNKKLANDVAKAQGRSALVETGTGAGVFTLPSVPVSALPLLEILPVQMITLAMAEVLNIQAGHFHLGTKITVIE